MTELDPKDDHKEKIAATTSLKQVSAPATTSTGIRMVLGTKTSVPMKRPSAFADEHERVSKSLKSDKELIESVEGFKVKGLNEEKDKGPLVIPLIRNNIWRTEGQEEVNINPAMASSIVPNLNQVSTPVPQKSTPSKSAPVDPESLQYGLNITKKPRNNENNHGTSIPNATEQPMDVDSSPSRQQQPLKGPVSLEEEAITALVSEAKRQRDGTVDNINAGSNMVLPILAQNAVPGLSTMERDEEKFLHDVSLRPDSASLEDYERVPVEEFGAALLRGMGWKEGTAVGKNANGIVEPVLVKPRPHLLGLGATPTPELEVKQKKYIKPGEKRQKVESSQRISQSTDLPRNIKEYRSDTAEMKRSSLSSKDSIRKGAYVVVNEGRHRKKRGTVLELKDKKDGIAVDIEVDSRDREVIRVWLEDLSIYEEKKDSRSSREISKQTSERNDSSSRSDIEISKKRNPSWLLPHIRVRIVSKSFKDGKYYNQKGVIQDIVAGSECSIRMDKSGTVVDGVFQKHLETCIPSAGKLVLIVSHADREHVGQSAKILEKNHDKEMAVVQLEQDCSQVLTVQFDEISEYLPEHPF